MKLGSRIMIIAGFVCMAIFASAGGARGESITFAGVEHRINEYGIWTDFGLGIDVTAAEVNRAYVTGPGTGIAHEYSASEFRSDGSEGFYWIALPGPPALGTYTFTVEFQDGSVDSTADTQGELVALPIITEGQVTIDNHHTTTPTLSWPDVSPGNYYRVNLFDGEGNNIYLSPRSAELSHTIPMDILDVGIQFRARVEVHDNDSFVPVNNRADGENFNMDTILIPFAGVTHVNTGGGIKTYFDLGINVPETLVARAYVSGPDGFSFEFQPTDFYASSGQYWISRDGPPALGGYAFTLELNDDTAQTVTDTQGPLTVLPIITAAQFEIVGGDGVTPTFRWPAVDGNILFYRVRIFDGSDTRILQTRRLGGTAFTAMPGDLQPFSNYEIRVEVHDSSSYSTLDNRSDGERLAFTTGAAPGPASGPLEVVSVPWVATAPLIPHDTYNGRNIAFKAIARGGDGTYAYEWDFDGDGTYDEAGTTIDPYDLSVRHTYPDQQFDKLFIARIRVTSGGETQTADYPVRVHVNATRGVRANVAIDEALWWLHRNLTRWDSGGVPFGTLPSQMLGATGAAVQAWENQGHKPGGNAAANPYVEDVRRGMNFILSKSHPYPIQMEDDRDPDTLVNGFGIHSIHQSQLYETGIVLMALASAGSTELTSEVGGFGMLGRTYGDIAQDMADFLAFAQNEPETGAWRGGWRYAPNYAQSDMSVTQWPVIGLEAAQSNFATLVPQYVKDELTFYLAADQDANGGFGYTSPGGNVARTGAGIACLAWIGAQPNDAPVVSAMEFIDFNWNWDNFGNLYAMYAVMKGMRGFEPDLTSIGSHDWYGEYADFLIQNQFGDGSWTSDVWYAQPLATASGVLILTPEVFLSPPVAVAKAVPTEASPGTVITFDHSDSFHRDPARSLTAFRWDFDEDGIWDEDSGDIAAKPTWTYTDVIGCGEEVQHLAVLEVEDDAGNTDVDDETVVIRINLNNHPPVADGDPTDSLPNYYVNPGEMVVLDATQSFDPDEPQGDYIVAWEWDLDNDGNFEVPGETLDFHVPSHWEPGSLHTVTLRVTDDGTWASACGGQPNLTDETTITLAVGSGLECADAAPSRSSLWPPNHEMVDIHILGLLDAQGNPALITITGITQDEPVNGVGDGDFLPDGAGVGTSTAQVRSERSGTGNGRVYNVRFTARDQSGANCSGAVNVYVPHNKKRVPVDDGQIYDATLAQ